MNRLMARCIGAIVPVVMASLALGQVPVIKYAQPWTPRLPSYESRVQSCANPLPLPTTVYAFDDWICPQTGPIIRVGWWGTLPGGIAQSTRPFVIAIYSDNPLACQPANLAAPLMRVCVVPDYVRPVGVDCQGRIVYHFSARLPAAIVFTQTAGTHYWLQICEPDAESIRPGLEDFRWSAHRPVMNCPAVQAPPFATLLDPCINNIDDLAFVLRSRTIVVILPPTILYQPALALTVNLRDPTTNMVVETMTVEPDPSGRCIAEPESPDGLYVIELIAMDLRPMRQTMPLQAGQELMISMGAVDCFGDFDGNGQITPADMANAVNRWFAALQNGC